MMNPYALMAVTLLASTPLAHGDALSLIQDAARNSDDAMVTETTEASPWFFIGALGGGAMFDSDFKGEDDLSVKYNPGIGLNLGVGYALNKHWAVEISTGLAWNGIDRISGFVNSTGVSLTASGGNGNLYQVPLIASIAWATPLGDRFTLGIAAGVGMQWTSFDLHDANLTANGTPFLTASQKKNSLAFRYQVGVQITREIASNIQLGFGVRFFGTSEVDLGEATFFPTGGGPSFKSTESRKLKNLMGFALGTSLKITF